jgi:hypothetical protein
VNRNDAAAPKRRDFIPTFRFQVAITFDEITSKKIADLLSPALRQLTDSSSANLMNNSLRGFALPNTPISVVENRQATLNS